MDAKLEFPRLADNFRSLRRTVSALTNDLFKTFKIGRREIGEFAPAYIIAEVGINHQGSIDRALELVRKAAEAGVDAVKFQKRDLASLYQKDMLTHLHRYERPYQYLLPILERTELSREDYLKIQALCRELGVEFLCTPFDIASADFLESLGVPAFKVASADLTNSMLIEHLATKKRPLILSTGAATMSEVEKTVSFLQFHKVDFALLHCNSSYPTLYADVNLKVMDQLKQFGVPVGYSGHEIGYVVPIAAIAFGAKIIEKHLTLDRSLEGPDHRVSLLPSELAEMVRAIRIVEESIGDGQKYMTQGEVMNREILGKSLVAARAIGAGEILTREMITVKSPGKGLSPQYLSQLLDRPATRDMKADDVFTDVDLHGNQETSIDIHPHGNWGLIVRPNDARSALRHRPTVLEYHLTSLDLKHPFPKFQSATELIIHAPEYVEQDLLDLCDPVESRRRESVRFVKKVLDRTRRLAASFQGKPKTIVHPGGMSFDTLDPSDIRGRRDQFRRSLEELLVHADKLDITLLPENLPPYPWYYGGQWRSHVFVDANEIREITEQLGCGMCFDLSHAQLYCTSAGKRLTDFARTIRPYVKHMHISDAKGLNGEGIQVGEGDIDFDDVLGSYADYTGTWVPEIWRGHLHGGKAFLTAINSISDSFRSNEVRLKRVAV